MAPTIHLTGPIVKTGMDFKVMLTNKPAKTGLGETKNTADGRRTSMKCKQQGFAKRRWKASRKAKEDG